MCLNMSYGKVQLRDGGFKIIAFPCGHCVECVKKYQNDWMLRLDDEATQWRTMMFATLTYSNGRIPFVRIAGDKLVDYRYYFMKRIAALPYKERSRYKDDTSGFYDYLFPERIATTDSLLVPYADISDIQKFMKRLRITFFRHEGRPLECKYFICSEYGPNTLRPHYHMILFCNEHEYLIQKYIKECYDLGNVHDIHRITSYKDRGVLDAMRYVSKYTSKPAEFENPYVVAGAIPKPRRLSSKGLGDHKRQEIKQAAYDYRAKYDADGYTPEFIEGYLHLTDIMKDGFKYGCPKYWRDVIFPQITVEDTRIENGKEIVKKSTIKDINHHLSLAISDYIQSKLDGVYHEEEEQLRQLHPDFTDTEIVRAHTVLHLEKQQQRYEKAVQSYYKHYAKAAGHIESTELPVNDGRLVNEDEKELVNNYTSIKETSNANYIDKLKDNMESIDIDKEVEKILMSNDDVISDEFGTYETLEDNFERIR